jgi:predicted nucleotidyltransferase
MEGSPTRGMIKRVAQALGPLKDRVVFVGGGVVDFYISPTVKPEDIRLTKDVDLVVEIISFGELEDFREALGRQGFFQSMEDNVICRFHWEELMIDVMSTQAVGWAPANRWFEIGFKNAHSVSVDGIEIRIMPLPIYLATKLDAFRSRSGLDPRTSTDLEDIVLILDNLPNWIENVQGAPQTVIAFLISEFKLFLGDAKIQEAILGNLPYGSQRERMDKLNADLRAICSRL